MLCSRCIEHYVTVFVNLSLSNALEKGLHGSASSSHVNVLETGKILTRFRFLFLLADVFLQNCDRYTHGLSQVNNYSHKCSKDCHRLMNYISDNRRGSYAEITEKCKIIIMIATGAWLTSR